MIEENILLQQLQEEAELCSNNEHNEDEVTAAIGLMLMHYQEVTYTQFTPKNKPISHTDSAKHTIREDGTPKSIRSNSGHQMRKNWKSNADKSPLLTCCRNILKEFLSQNDM